MPEAVEDTSAIQIQNISYLIESMEYGRCIIFNIRKFMLYQTTIALNLSLFLLIGEIRFKEPPVSPSTILWLNFVMDTMAGIIFGSELPDMSVARITPRPENEESLQKDPKYTKWQPYMSILDKTEPTNPTDGLFNSDMKFMLVSQTIYQQLVLTMIFYFGEIWFVWIHGNKFINYDNINCHDKSFNEKLSGPERWAEEHFYCANKPFPPTQKNIAFSFVYETFFWMQMFNINNCRRVFDYCTVPFRRVLKLFYYGFKELI